MKPTTKQAWKNYWGYVRKCYPFPSLTAEIKQQALEIFREVQNGIH